LEEGRIAGRRLRRVHLLRVDVRRIYSGSAPSPIIASRDRVLSRAFDAVELMFSATDAQVQDLAYIGLLEGRERWWLQRSEPFLGPAAQAELDRHRPAWRKEIAGPTMSPVPEILDLYDVRGLIAKELNCAVADIPGRTHVERNETAT
jgi:hypothetical protein